MIEQSNHLPHAEGQIERPKGFDWQSYDRLTAELDRADLADSSYHRSAQNLEILGWDEHVIYPGEETILTDAMTDILERIAELGTPPACVDCKRAGEVFRSTETPLGERLSDEHPSTCRCCGGSGDYQALEVVEDDNSAPDAHLERDYDDRYAWNDSDDGRWDDDPNPYDGTYSETERSHRMTERVIHHLSVRIEKWQTTRAAWEPRTSTDENYRGFPEQCDTIAAANGATTMTEQSSAHERVPFHDRLYFDQTDDGEATLVWCRSTPIADGYSTTWRVLLPSVDEVYPRVTEPAPDAHLESDDEADMTSWGGDS